jgi:dGTPase
MKKFAAQAMIAGNSNYEISVGRIWEMYRKTEDIRSEFSRDYNRILHCNAFRRLKHKTQVFYATMNDHICTRIEHVYHVEAVSRTICDELGLNSELAVAISLGHDLGHAPFGHEGEKIISRLSEEYLGKIFWHEKNSLRVVDCIETLPDLAGNDRPLNLTYAVRDGIVSHCGEVDQNGLFPRSEAIDLRQIERPNQYAPYTWEGCVVKIADKIAYLGRDIEDALRLGVLSDIQVEELNSIIQKKYPNVVESVLTTSLMHNLIINLCENSSPAEGIRFDQEHYELMNNIKKFNYQNIYRHPRINRYNRYVELIISTLFSFLLELFDGENTLQSVINGCKPYSELNASFSDWIIRYSEASGNLATFDIKNRESYIDSLLTYLSLTTDQYAMRLYNELIKF